MERQGEGVMGRCGRWNKKKTGRRGDGRDVETEKEGEGKTRRPGTGRRRIGVKELNLDLNPVCNYNVITDFKEVISNESKSCKNW